MNQNDTGNIESQTQFIRCNGNDECTNPDTTCQELEKSGYRVCFCVYTLKPIRPNEKCEYVEVHPSSGLDGYKECRDHSDCLADVSMCMENPASGIKICHCIYELKQADIHGNCSQERRVEEEPENDGVIHHLPPVFGKPSPMNITSNTTDHVPLLSQNTHKENPLQMLQVLLPVSFALVLTFIVALIIIRRLHLCRKRKSRKGFPVKGREDVQLLDRMSIVNKNPSYYMTLTGKQFPIKEIDGNSVKVLDVVGEGAFGHVYKGLLCLPNQSTKEIAIKVLKEGVSNEVREDFEREVEIMSSFDHDNILKLLGVVTKGCCESPYMIFEYMEHGDLAELLRRNDPAMRKDENVFKLKKTDLIDISIQIATGMTYLTSQHFVHRDLATRNCLVGNQLIVKISDFGMARDIYTCDYYKIGGSRMLPVRWMSPEGIKYGQFTTESDIWAFGVVLWEIFSFGRQPYYGHANEEVIRFLEEGILLQRPEECPSTVYHIMLGCWKSGPKERLPFIRILKHLVDFSNDVIKNTRIENKNEDMVDDHLPV